ncbi:STAS domain-containing protein [Streptomyces sp. NPDC054840]
MKPAFRIAIRRYGTTLCLTPLGDLDLDSCPAFDQVDHAVGTDTTFVACTMAHVAFMDLNGLHCLVALAGRLEVRGVRLVVHAWRPQPRQLLDLIDDLGSLPDGKIRERRAAATALRRVLDFRAHEEHEHGMSRAQADFVPSGAIAGLSRRPGTFRSLR